MGGWSDHHGPSWDSWEAILQVSSHHHHPWSNLKDAYATHLLHHFVSTQIHTNPGITDVASHVEIKGFKAWFRKSPGSNMGLGPPKWTPFISQGEISPNLPMYKAIYSFIYN